MMSNCKVSLITNGLSLCKYKHCEGLNVCGVAVMLMVTCFLCC